ncbi:hypothetical protein N9383_05640 [Granulosicoccus sp.]|nr:hypothetical protein [Granulosicoccus sp.]
MKKFLTTLSIAAAYFFVVGNTHAQDANFDDIAIKCNNGKYLSSENGEKAMSCNRTRIGDWEVFTVVLIPGEGFILLANTPGQASSRSIVRVSGQQQVLTARGTSNNDRTIFAYGFPDSDSSIRSISRVSNGLLWSSENGEKPATVTRTRTREYERFTIESVN